jgi:hypothetical protein
VKTILTATIILALFSSIQPCASKNNAPLWKTITEEDVRILSARLYRDILITACMNGWRYSRKQIERGFKRHLEELTLQLSSSGYRIVVASTGSDVSRRHSSKARISGNKKSPTFGCARQYWIESRD